MQKGLREFAGILLLGIAIFFTSYYIGCGYDNSSGSNFNQNGNGNTNGNQNDNGNY